MATMLKQATVEEGYSRTSDIILYFLGYLRRTIPISGEQRSIEHQNNVENILM